MALSVEEQRALAPEWAVRLDGRYEVCPASGCWVWSGAVDRYGYGMLKVKTLHGDRTTGAHRASWVVHRGVVSPTLTIDHLCRLKTCVNPDHLEPVTNAENIRRRTADNPGGTGRPRIPLQERQGCGTHGRADGRFDTRKDGYTAWVCRICNRERMARFHANKKAA